jgi:hypothetical protein
LAIAGPSRAAALCLVVAVVLAPGGGSLQVAADGVNTYREIEPPDPGGTVGSAVTTAAAETIANDQVWFDTSGHPILAQGGSILRRGETYYWYGRAFDGNFTINCYVSTDLVHWSFAHAVFQNSAALNNKMVPAEGWVGRPDVLYNASTGQYVMTVEYNVGVGRNTLAFLTSTSPTGDFWWRPASEVRFPDGVHTMGDKGMFQDTDGQAYLLYVSDDSRTNSNQKIQRLTPDFLGLGNIVHNTAGGGHEAMSIIRRNGTYYLFSSQTRGWYSSATMYKKSTTLTGFPTSGGDDGRGWTLVRTSPKSQALNTFNTQHDFVLPVPGSTGTAFVYAGDRWNNREAQVGGVGLYGWFPLTFDASGSPTIRGERAWSLDEAAGTWLARPDGLSNPGFEWDIVKDHPTQQAVTGWAETSSIGTLAASKATAGGARSGFYKLEHSSGSAYRVYTSQQQTGILNGTYVLRAWIKSSGGQNQAYMSVTGHGGAERRVSIPVSPTWTQITIPDIAVTSGRITVGFYSDATPGQFLHVDDVDLLMQ